MVIDCACSHQKPHEPQILGSRCLIGHLSKEMDR